MKDQLLIYKNKILETWSSFSRTQKIMLIGTLLLLFISLILLINWSSKPEFVPIYSNLSPVEAGEIVSEIETKGIPVQLSSDGTSVSVPSAEAAKLKVELAHAGIPRSGNINYGVFSENMGFGMTDKQFDVVERDAMQNELRYLIEQIDGVQQAQVMITMPKESVWVTPNEQSSSASVVLTTRPGLQLDQTQVNGLYHLISRSIPNLPTENIVIMNQNWQAFEMIDESQIDTKISAHQQQRQVRKDIERDIQRELQQMLGTILGMDKVIVSVFANVDFSTERREEQLVQPVDPATNEGIAISIERIQESFSGQGGSPGGIPGTGEGDIAGYQGAEGSQDSEYEKIEERINNEVNRIYREIESSPYTIDDLTINVGVEPPVVGDPTSLTNENIDDIKSVLKSVVRTYLSSSPGMASEAELDQKINVFANEFRGRPDLTETAGTGISTNVLYGLAAVAALALAGVAFTFIRRARRKEETVEDVPAAQPGLQDFDFDQENEETARRKRIERLANSKPDEFVKLLRTWISED
jgi:flagellar M-ring protein FliF